MRMWQRPIYDEVAMVIFNLLEDRTLVAHNVGFDGPLLCLL